MTMISRDRTGTFFPPKGYPISSRGGGGVALVSHCISSLPQRYTYGKDEASLLIWLVELIALQDSRI